MTDAIWLWLIAGGIICLTCIVTLYRLIRCPSNRLLLVRNRMAGIMGWEPDVEARHGGGHFVWPFLQEYRFLDLSPIKISVDLSACSEQEVRDPSTYYFKACLDMGSEDELRYVGEQFWNRNQEQIVQELKRNVEQNISDIVSSKDLPSINNERNDFLVELEQKLSRELTEDGFELLTISHKP